MDQQHFWLLVSLKLSGEASPDELDELEQYIQRHPETNLKLEAVMGIWNEKPVSADLTHSFNLLLEKLEKDENKVENVPYFESLSAYVSGKKKRVVYFLVAAASVAVAFICWIYFYNEKSGLIDKEPLAANIITTEKGSKTSVQLPDGTKVWLNADSKINYDENFKDDVREVQLEGEAFFDVKKDSSRPFIIHTSTIDIKVLGTKFNVKSYKDETTSETSLISGKVEISIKNNPEKKIILKPNEKLVVQQRNSNNDLIKDKERYDKPLLVVKTLRKDSAYERSLETLWLDNKLVFDSEPLEEVCRKLERWYNVKIDLRDDDIKQETYTAIFDGETLLNVLTALKMADKLDFIITNNEVSIFKKE